MHFSHRHPVPASTIRWSFRILRNFSMSFSNSAFLRGSFKAYFLRKLITGRLHLVSDINTDLDLLQDTFLRSTNHLRCFQCTKGEYCGSANAGYYLSLGLRGHSMMIGVNPVTAPNEAFTIERFFFPFFAFL